MYLNCIGFIVEAVLRLLGNKCPPNPNATTARYLVGGGHTTANTVSLTKMLRCFSFRIKMLRCRRLPRDFPLLFLWELTQLAHLLTCPVCKVVYYNPSLGAELDMSEEPVGGAVCPIKCRPREHKDWKFC